LSNKNYDIVVVGELNVDLILQDIATFPEIGKEKIAKNMLLTMGSASAIFASNIAKLGNKTGFIGKIGNDSYGKLVTDTLVDRGVNTSSILIDKKSKTGITVAMTFPHNYAMVTYMGAMEEFSINDVDFEFLKQAKHMHFASYYLQPGIRPDCHTLFEKCKNYGITTSFDPSWDPDEEWKDDIYKVLKNTDVFLPNEQEAINISGCKTIEDALEKLSEYSKIVVIKLGEKGAITKYQDEIIRTKTFNLEPKDTTGAGDSFNAGFISNWLVDNDIKKSLIMGNACGAIATTKLGGSTASPDTKELNQFLDQHRENIFV
jgi:sugar/nucleoside kinase (ribokinase family)